MKKAKLETLQFFLKLAIIVGLPYNFRIQSEANEHKAEINTTDWLDLKERMSKIEAENVQHKTEIAFLKTTIGEDRYAIKELDGRVTQLEASKEILSSRPKRPFRLKKKLPT